MAKHLWSSGSAMFCLLFLAILCAGSAPSGASAQALVAGAFSPPPSCPDGWVVKEPARTFTEANLYEYINGEAELYLPYRFAKLLSILYGSPKEGGDAVVADIYEMGSPLDAFGIYSRYRSTDSPAVKIGTEGLVNDAEVLFFHDRYFVKVSASGAVEPDILMTCAGLISQRISLSPLMPAELDLMAQEGLVPRSIVYVPGGLMGYRFLGRGLTGDIKIGEETGRAFIGIYKTAGEALKAFDDYRRYLEGKGMAPIVSGGSGATLVMEVADPLYKGTVVSPEGAYILGIGRLARPGSGREPIETWRKAMRSR